MLHDTCLDDMANALLNVPHNDAMVTKGSALDMRMKELAAERAQKKSAPEAWARMFKDTKLKKVTKEVEIMAAKLQLEFDSECAYARLRSSELDGILREALKATKAAKDVGTVQRIVDDVQSKASNLVNKKWWLKRGAFDVLEKGAEEEERQMRSEIESGKKLKKK